MPLMEQKDSPLNRSDGSSGVHSRGLTDFVELLETMNRQTKLLRR